MLFQVSVVRTAGLEPARPYGLEILSLVRLPFRQVRVGGGFLACHKVIGKSLL